MNSFKLYLKEVKYLYWYITACLTAIIISYSVYGVFDAETVARLGDEDQFFEWLTAISLLIASVLFGILFFKSRNIFYILLAVLFFFGFGEEISWGQRLIGFTTPEALNKYNVQGEFTIHNLEPLNTHNIDSGSKSGLGRLFEINFLFKIFTVFVLLLLPLAAFHTKAGSRITRMLKIPVPPASIAILFSVNWIVFKLLLTYFALPGQRFQYYDTDTEIFEFVSAFIILVMASYFFLTKKEIAPGEDVKEYLIDSGIVEKQNIEALFPDLAAIFMWKYSPLRYLIKIKDFLILRLPFN
ncbi:MAG: hypothetical protein ACM3UT_14015 [Chloroflexota bacterium]